MRFRLRVCQPVDTQQVHQLIRNLKDDAQDMAFLLYETI